MVTLIHISHSVLSLEQWLAKLTVVAFTENKEQPFGYQNTTKTSSAHFIKIDVDNFPLTLFLTIHLVEQCPVAPLLDGAGHPVADPEGEGVAVDVEVPGGAPGSNQMIRGGANAKDKCAGGACEENGLQYGYQ